MNTLDITNDIAEARLELEERAERVRQSRARLAERAERVRIEIAELTERAERARLERAEDRLQRLKEQERKEQRRKEHPPRLPGDEIVDTFRRSLTSPWVGLCSELYEAMGITKGSAMARIFRNPQALGWHLKEKLDNGDAAYFKKRSSRGQQYTIQPLAEEELPHLPILSYE